MNFNNKKLSFGIAYVGLIVFCSLIGIQFNIGNFFSNKFSDPTYAVPLYLFLYLSCTLPVDILVGKKLNKAKDNSVKRIIVYNSGFLLFFLLCSYFLLIVFHKKSYLLMILYSILIQIVILMIQGLLPRLIFHTSRSKYKANEIVELKNSPDYLTMNIVRFFFKTQIIVPKIWLQEKRENYLFHIERFILSIRERTNLSVILTSVAVNSLLSCVLFSTIINYYQEPIEQLINFSLLSNLTSFVCILILPKFSQQGILNTDTKMKALNTSYFEENLDIFEQHQDKNITREKVIESIFYPVPSVNSRINNTKKFTVGLPNISRITIFLFSSNLSIIFKGVHGNAGKPENWIFPPSE